MKRHSKSTKRHSKSTKRHSKSTKRHSKSTHPTYKKRSFRNSKNTTKRIFFNFKKQRGGLRSSNIWETDASAYPSVYGLDNKAVLFPVSKYGVPGGFFDPPVPSNGPNGNGPVNGPYLGGRRRNSKYRGGGNQSTLAPQSLVNLTRSMIGSAQETLNGFNGYTNSASLNPMPYDQPIDQNIEYLRTDFPNVAQSYNKADSYVSNI